MDFNTKRAVVIAGHFMPEVGYFEVYLAKNLARLGYSVRVITTDQVSPAKQVVVGNSYPTGSSKLESGLEVLRLKASWKAGSMILARGLKQATLEFKPDVIFALGTGKLFPLSVFSLGNRIPIYSFFGENSDYFSNSTKLTSFKNKFLKSTVKRLVYNKAFRSSEKIVAYTPETSEILLRTIAFPWNRECLLSKVVESSLGFDSEQFYFQEDARLNIREELGLNSSDILLVTSTRVTASKGLEQVVDIVTRFNKEGLSVYYVMIGFHNDQYGNRLKKYIAQSGFGHKFVCLPFSNHDKIRAYYSAADIGVWLRAAISIQEAMGTGLPVVLPRRNSVRHLLKSGVNGEYYDDNLQTVLRGLVTQPLPSRQTVMQHNSRFSYQSILQSIL